MSSGIEAVKGVTLRDKAKLDRIIGPSGLTVVKPMRAKTTM